MTPTTIFVAISILVTSPTVGAKNDCCRLTWQVAKRYTVVHSLSAFLEEWGRESKGKENNKVQLKVELINQFAKIEKRKRIIIMTNIYLYMNVYKK